MLALAEILALVILNALLHAAFTRWKSTRRTARSARVMKVKRVAAPHYPLHPSPVSFGLEAAPEHATYIRPAGIDW